MYTCFTGKQSLARILVRSLGLETKIHQKNRRSLVSRVAMQKSEDNSRPVNIGQLIKEKEEKKEPYYSVELVSRVGGDAVYKRFFEAVQTVHSPTFYALTWHGKSEKDFVSLNLLQNFPDNTLLHLIARGLKKNDVEDILDRTLELKITNLLVLRGDNAADDGDFVYATDLIEFITKKYGDKFCIGVAGYPDTHPESASKVEDLYYLKKKVDAGASFVLTQILFESQPFLQFVKDCRAHKINVPIIPGIYPITKYKNLLNLEKWCQLSVPDEIHQSLKKIKDDDVAVEKYGINLAATVAREILSSGIVHGFHLYTFNRPTIAQKVSTSVFTGIKMQN